MQAIKGTVASLVAFIACPCHLPLTLPLLLSLTSGTAAGLWPAAHQQFMWAVSVVLFVGSAALTVRWLQDAQAGAHCASPMARPQETTMPANPGSGDYPTHLQANQKVEI